MASFWSLLGIVFMALTSSSSASSHPLLHISTISAAPASLPLSPLSPPVTIPAAPATLPATPEPRSPFPALSPDISPLLPSPSGGAASPTQSSLPIIPSNPSPPNPDSVAAGGSMPLPLAPAEEEPIVADSGSVRVEALMYPASLILCSLTVYPMQLIGM